MIGIVLAAALASAPILRLHVDVREYGLRGTGVMILDRRDRRYVRRFYVGPAGDAEGYDGRNIWIADAANNAYIQGNADTRNEVLRWSSLLHGIADGAKPRTVPIRVGNDTEVITFSDYRRESGGLQIPFAMRIRDQQGTRELRVTSVEHLAEISDTAFAPPAAPNDASVGNPSGVTVISFLPEHLAGHTLPLVVIPVRVNNGPPMRFLLDTGGQNILSPAAASRLHLLPEGGAHVGGGGSGTAAVSFAWAQTVRTGEAEMRHQPFMILALDLLPDIDGIVGAEMLSRFAARFEFEHNRLLLARRAPAAWFTDGDVASIGFNKNMPDLAGVLDGSAGRFTLDTGATGSLDINAPFAKDHDLYRRYHAAANAHFTGIGGKINAARITARSVTLGTLAMHDVPARLTLDRGGVSDDPTTAGNVGEQIFRRYTVTFDYSTLRIDFQKANGRP